MTYIKLTNPTKYPDRVWWLELESTNEWGYRCSNYCWLDIHGKFMPAISKLLNVDEGDVLEEITKDQFNVLCRLTELERV